MTHEARSSGTTRRGFLRLAGSTAALAAIAKLPTAAATGDADAGVDRVFSDDEREILTQLVERMVDTGVPDAPAVRETATIQTIERVCAGLDASLVGPLGLALRLFEYGPIVFDFRFSRFSTLDDAGKDAALEGWMRSRFGFRRMAFAAVRNLAFLGYWSQDETWPLIGYRGPLLARGRK